MRIGFSKDINEVLNVMALELEFVSRETAHLQGRKLYFNGAPCKHGHIAPRYVSTGGCTACLKRYKPRLNAFSKDLVPYDLGYAWRSRRLTVEQLKDMGRYLQECIYAYQRHLGLPEVCKACDGTKRVPTGRMGGWGDCPACVLPPTAVVPTAPSAPAGKYDLDEGEA